MKRFGIVLIALATLLNMGLFLASNHMTAYAQVPNNPYQFSVNSATHTSCTVTASTTTFCFATDGIWQSLGGAAFTQVGAVQQVGVTSFNGRTGAVTFVVSDIPPLKSITGSPITIQ